MPASTATASHAGAKEPPMTVTDAVPTASAEDIGNRILRLIDSLKGPSDLNPAHVERATGIRVQTDPENSLRWGFGGPVDAQWNYDLGTITTADGKSVEGLLFAFEPSEGEPDPAPVCTPDFDHYRHALEQAGFSAQPVRGRFGTVDSWNFERDAVSVHAYLRRNPGSRERLPCLHQMIIRTNG